MVRIVSLDLDLHKIADSGQCFRLTEEEAGRFLLIAHGQRLLLDATQDGAVLHCSDEAFQSLWRFYLDLDTDYARFRAAIPAEDRYLTAAAQYGRGIRILRQDPWEMLVTFIISQRKTIPAIRRSVEQLCRLCGQPLSPTGYAFPTPDRVAALSPKALSACSLGYRAPYVHGAAQLVASGELDLTAAAGLRDAPLLDALQSAPGVGPKVANCVALFGYHRLSGFPRDVWINRILAEQYHDHFSLRRYRGFEGVIQQYLFYYARRDVGKGR